MNEKGTNDWPSLSELMVRDMGFVLSHWQDDDGISGIPIDGPGCASKAAGSWESNSHIWNFEVKTDGSAEPIDKGELIIGETAPKLSDCDNPDCTGCNRAWYENVPETTFYVCTDETRYKYRFRCSSSWWNKGLCG